MYPATQPCRLMVKVKVEGHEIEPWISCPLHVSFTPGMISLNFGQIFASVKWCAEPTIQPCTLKIKATIEGHKFESLLLSRFPKVPPRWLSFCGSRFSCPSVYRYLLVICRARPLSVYQKINFLVYPPKHTLWVLKRTISMRRFFWAPKTYVKTDG